jgi:replication-associated recombination protein RarA
MEKVESVEGVNVARDLPPTRRGYSPHDVVSAIQKAMRRSDPEAVVYWGTELFKSGYGAWAWKRLRIVMSEDVGLGAAPGVIADVEALHACAEDFKKKAGSKASPEDGLFFWIHAALLLCVQPKSRTVDWMYMQALSNHAERREIPDEAFDVHTRKGRTMGRRWPHFVEESGRLIQPDEAAQARGHASMADEIASIDERYTQHFLDRQSKEGRANLPPENKWSEQSRPTPKGSDVKTHYVQRPLGIPLPGEDGVKEDEEDGDDD